MAQPTKKKTPSAPPVPKTDRVSDRKERNRKANEHRRAQNDYIRAQGTFDQRLEMVHNAVVVSNGDNAVAFEFAAATTLTPHEAKKVKRMIKRHGWFNGLSGLWSKKQQAY